AGAPAGDCVAGGAFWGAGGWAGGAAGDCAGAAAGCAGAPPGDCAGDATGAGGAPLVGAVIAAFAAVGASPSAGARLPMLARSGPIRSFPSRTGRSKM